MVRKRIRKNDAELFVYEIGLHCIVRENPAGGLRVVRSTEKLCRKNEHCVSAFGQYNST